MTGDEQQPAADPASQPVPVPPPVAPPPDETGHVPLVSEHATPLPDAAPAEQLNHPHVDVPELPPAQQPAGWDPSAGPAADQTWAQPQPVSHQPEPQQQQPEPQQPGYQPAQPAVAEQQAAVEQHSVAEQPQYQPQPVEHVEQQPQAQQVPQSPVVEMPAGLMPSYGASADGDDPLAMLKRAVTTAVRQGGSDIHIHAGITPMVRVSGALQPIPGQPALDEDWLLEALRSMTSHAPDKFKEYREIGEADFSWAVPGTARFRVNLFRERGNTSVVLRAIPNDVPSLADIGVPEGIHTLSNAERGLILVTGATGSGKSTTLAAIIDHINTNYEKHILTIEDPIEMLHTNKRSLVSQREVGSDTPDFGQALRRALRQDPDVILIGEIRDEETMHVALRAAETGHLVLSTLHTMSAAESITRILDLFPPAHERQARAMLAAVLQGAVSQRLVRDVNGGRVPAVEVMLQTGRVQRCIQDPAETGKLHDVMQEGGYYGMQTFDQALLALLMEGRITVDEAVRNANSPQNFKLMMEASGLGPDGLMTHEASQRRANDLKAQADATLPELGRELGDIHDQMRAQGMQVPPAPPPPPPPPQGDAHAA